MEKLRLYVNPAWRRKGIHSPLLNPWWGNPHTDASLFAKEMFDAHPFDVGCYEITDELGKAEMVFPPYRHQWLLRHDPGLLEECIREARASKLPILLDGMGDVEYPFNEPNAYILRIGGYRFIPEEGRILVPPPSDDLLERCRNGELLVRQKSEGAPTVGFAGWASLTTAQHVRTTIKEIPWRLLGFFNDRYWAMSKGVLWRAKALRVLEASTRVRLNLRKRNSFSGSVKTAEKDMRALREELVETVLESDYALDVRGDANATTRLFEILSLGRIPVVLDTERNFPFNDAIDYRTFCVIVDFREIRRLPDIVAEFHSRVSPEEFVAMQQRAREAFVAYFRIDAQMKHIVRQLREEL